MTILRSLVLLVCLAPAVALGDVVDSDTVEISPESGIDVDRIEVENPLGDVSIVGHDGDAVILRVIKRAPDEETLDRLKVSLVPDPLGIVRVRSRILFAGEARPVSIGPTRVDIQLAVPRRVRVSVQAWAGRVSIDDIHGGASLRVHEGDLSVTRVSGPVATTSTRGHQRLQNVRGNVVATGTYGDVELERVVGDELTARTHDGRVVATGIRARSVTIRSTYGHVIFEGQLRPGGSYDVRSFHGDVQIRLSEESAVSIAAFSRDGQVESKLEMADGARRDGHRLEGSYGPSRRKPALLSVSSLAGNVTVGLINE